MPSRRPPRNRQDTKPATALVKESAIHANRATNNTSSSRISVVNPPESSTRSISRAAWTVIAMAGRMTAQRRSAINGGLSASLPARGVAGPCNACTGMAIGDSGGSAAAASSATWSNGIAKSR